MRFKKKKEGETEKENLRKRIKKEYRMIMWINNKKLKWKSDIKRWQERKLIIEKAMYEFWKKEMKRELKKENQWRVWRNKQKW